MNRTVINILPIFIFFLAINGFDSWASEKSQCYGTSHKGRLEGGKKLPLEGKNFSSYSQAAWILGRTYVHAEVYKIMIQTYDMLNAKFPKKVFVYGETGWKRGGSFKPHRTHQNGLSVDFMAPVLDSKATSVELPCSITNKFCYSIEFNSKGHYKDLHIDFEAMAEHLYWLHKSAGQMGVKIKKVIFDPQLQTFLKQTKPWNYLKKNIRFSKHRVWVRHDEHYHVDFEIPCKKL